MVNYNNGKVYKIEPICEHDDGEIYIGSTTNTLNKRMITHRCDYKRYKNGKGGCYTSYTLFDKYGIENCRIILLELVNCNSKDELLAREGYYIRILKCVNMIIPDRKKQQYFEDTKEERCKYQKLYYEKHKYEINEKLKIKFICECGHECRTSDKYKHFKSKKHIAFMESLSSKVVNISF